MIRTLAEVAAYIDENSNALPSQSAQEQFDHYEMLAISELDSSWDNYPEDVLQDFLMDYLENKRLKLGI